MFKVEWKDAANINCIEECQDLLEAMAFAKGIDSFVEIKGNGVEIVGRFGVDSVKEGLCPDGHAYTWKKLRNRSTRFLKRR